MAMFLETRPTVKAAQRGGGEMGGARLAHLVEGVEVPFAHVLLEDPRLRREVQLDPCSGSGNPPNGLTTEPQGAPPCEPGPSEKVRSLPQEPGLGGQCGWAAPLRPAPREASQPTFSSR